MKVKAQDKERLDQVHHRILGNLEAFAATLELNPALLDNPVLEAGTEVLLPDVVEDDAGSAEYQGLWE